MHTFIKQCVEPQKTPILIEIIESISCTSKIAFARVVSSLNQD